MQFSKYSAIHNTWSVSFIIIILIHLSFCSLFSKIGESMNCSHMILLLNTPIHLLVISTLKRPVQYCPIQPYGYWSHVSTFPHKLHQWKVQDHWLVLVSRFKLWQGAFPCSSNAHWHKHCAWFTHRTHGLCSILSIANDLCMAQLLLTSLPILVIIVPAKSG